MARSRLSTVVQLIGIALACVFVFGADFVWLNANAPAQDQGRIIIGAPLSGDDWPIGTAQSIRWATNFSPSHGSLSDVRITVELLGEAGSQELLLDDGEQDLSFDQGDRIVVLRITPPSYPATLEAIRVLVPAITGQPERERDITLYYFADEQGSGSPPSPQRFLTQPARVRTSGSFTEIRVEQTPLPTLRQGDFYIGYLIEAPTGGFVYPIDRDTTQRRTFIADRGGDQFRDAVFPDPSGFQVSGNLMVRARVNVSATRIPLTPPGGVPNTGEFCWKVRLSEGQEPMMGSERRPARIKVSATINGVEVATSNEVQFSISRALQSIRVTSPSSGEIWRDQEERIIRWEAERLVGDVRIELLRFTDSATQPSEVFCLFDGEDVLAKQRSWQVGRRTPGFYKIRVSSSLDARIFDDSDFFVIDQRAKRSLTWEDWAPFMPQGGEPAMLASSAGTCGIHFVPDASGASLQIVAPNGGEVFRPGDRVNIVWGSQRIRAGSKLRIVLFDYTKTPVVQETLFSGVENTGLMVWTVPFRLSEAVKVGVMSEYNPNIADVSDGTFSIGIPNQGRIRILMPDGGEEFEVGQETRLVWISEGNDVGSQVRIDISFDNGISWRVLCNEVRCTQAANNGDFRLGLNFPPSDCVKVRVVSRSRPQISDTSNCSFRIVAPRPPDPNAPKCPPKPQR